MTTRSLRTTGALLCTLPLLWTACGGDDAPEPPAKSTPKAAAPAEPPQAAAPKSPTGPDFTDTEWQLVSIEPMGSDAIAPAPDAVPTISFGAQAGSGGPERMTGFGGCNRFFGDYSVSDDGALSIPEALGSTRMACPEPIMGVETAFLQALGSASRYSLEGDALIVLYAEGALRFKGG
jgi:heat shock protein HslJ